MSSTAEILWVAITVIQAVTGITLNAYILSFNVENLKRQPNLNPINVIYCAMGLVNVFLQLVHTVQNLISCFWFQLFLLREISIPISFLMMGLMYCNYWLTGLLSVYYCITINNFTHHLFVGLKRFVSSSLPHLLLLSIICALLLSVPTIWMTFVVRTSTNDTQGTSPSVENVEVPVGYRQAATILGCCLPFVLVLVNTGVTTLSLIQHILKMKENNSKQSSPNLQVLVRATRTMVLLLTNSIVFYIAQLWFLSVGRFYHSDIKVLIVWIIITSFPSAEGVIISQANPKMKRMILAMCCAKKSNNVTN